MDAPAQRRLMRRVAWAAGVWLFLLLAPSSPAAAATPWQIAASPTQLSANVPTQVVLAVTGGSQRVGLIVITIPSGYTIESVAVLTPPPGQSWSAVVKPPSQVMFQTNSYPAGIDFGSSATFAITVQPTSQSPPAWVASAYRQHYTPSDSDAQPQVALPAFVIVGAVAPTPGPAVTPTAMSRATRTPGPTATPHPKSTVASAAPESESPLPIASDPAAASQSTAAGSAEDAGVTGPGSGSAIVVPSLSGDTVVSLAGLGGFESLGLYSWLVPGFALGLPGILVLVIAFVQAGAGSLFLPLARRALGKFWLRGRG